MELYLSPEHVEPILEIAKSFHLDAKVIGHCEYAQTKKLTIQNEQGNFEYLY
jgi:phosphoribosylformylglycinamidine cyclo-ligase